MVEQSKPQPETKDKYDPDSVYANNVRFETSVWDLKAVFGQLEQLPPSGELSVDWHTAVTMPWLVAKLLIYYLRINVAAYELANGCIKVRVVR